jgi:hypothetical protein
MNAGEIKIGTLIQTADKTNYRVVDMDSHKVMVIQEGFPDARVFGVDVPDLISDINKGLSKVVNENRIFKSLEIKIGARIGVLKGPIAVPGTAFTVVGIFAGGTVYALMDNSTQIVSNFKKERLMEEIECENMFVISNEPIEVTVNNMVREILDFETALKSI